MTTTGTRAEARKTDRTDAVTTGRRRHPGRGGRLARWIVLAIGALVFLFPFYYMVIGSLQTKPDTSPAGAFPNPANITLQNYVADQRAHQPAVGSGELRHLHRRSDPVHRGVRRAGRLRAVGAALARPRGHVLDRAARADRAVPAADDPALRADRTGLRTGRHASGHDPAVRDQLGGGAHLPAVLPAGAAGAVRCGTHRRCERTAGAVEHRPAARASGAAHGRPAHLHRARGTSSSGRSSSPRRPPCSRWPYRSRTTSRPWPPRRPTRSGRSSPARWCSRSPPSSLFIVFQRHFQSSRRRLGGQGMTGLKTRLPTVPYTLTRVGVVMTPEAGNPLEVEGVLNPASGRGPDGELYLLPRLVAAGNVSRVGLARVVVEDGIPVGVERQGVVLEPDRSWERGVGNAGVEDPRITWMADLGLFVMTYVAYGPLGPRTALAVSSDLREWRRLGPVLFTYDDALDIDLNLFHNKDTVFFPEPVTGAGWGARASRCCTGRCGISARRRPIRACVLPAGTTDPRRVDLDQLRAGRGGREGPVGARAVERAPIPRRARVPIRGHQDRRRACSRPGSGGLAASAPRRDRAHREGVRPPAERPLRRRRDPAGRRGSLDRDRAHARAAARRPRPRTSAAGSCRTWSSRPRSRRSTA